MAAGPLSGGARMPVFWSAQWLCSPRHRAARM